MRALHVPALALLLALGTPGNTRAQTLQDEIAQLRQEVAKLRLEMLQQRAEFQNWKVQNLNHMARADEE